MGDGCGDEKVWARGPYLSLFLQLQFNYCSSALQKDFVIFLSYGKEHKFCSWKMPLSIILNLLEMHNVLYSSPRIENVSLNFRIKELLSKKKNLKRKKQSPTLPLLPERLLAPATSKQNPARGTRKARSTAPAVGDVQMSIATLICALSWDNRVQQQVTER